MELSMIDKNNCWKLGIIIEMREKLLIFGVRWLFDLKKKKRGKLKEYSSRIYTIIKMTTVELMWSNIDRIRLSI